MSPGHVTPLENEIARLRGLDRAGLQARWRTMFGRRPPAHLPRHLLLRVIAYRLQADVHGDLDAASSRYLSGWPRRGRAARDLFLSQVPSGPAPCWCASGMGCCIA